MQVKVKRLTETAKFPVKAHKTDAGFDIFADEDIEIRRGKTIGVRTGIAIQIDHGFYGKLKCRSGLSLKSLLRVVEGTIDADYRGEVKVICEIKDFIYFENDEIAGTQETYSYQINHGDKIAQLIIQPLPPVDLKEVDELDDTERGVCGFGSTGKR
ncbi:MULTISPECIES: dUTP diphosphatase [unclassified Enterococcus]|uniref:dUTP diphosphatase n=1 Tax=unclassified Enterococcus TaxID=2608891 RepID=UPI000A3589E9|nr:MULTISPECIES: dUTP diphosphatase [unclassified Enterococcus]OTO71310.1 hypothetical protein A5865_003006 [Enterococcus sp. 12E11_DIV0728]OUZ15314.1 hypothetical protein A5868_000222 [Enterococcus sp. 12F9_DIV0723]